MTGRPPRRRLRRVASGLVPAVAVALLAGLAFCGWRLWEMRQDNAVITALAAGRDVAVAADASPPVLFARAHWLLQRDRFEEAQALLGRLDARREGPAVSALLYDLANARMRSAFDRIQKGRLDAATGLVTLAKQEYRQALAIAPADWDIKYNLDVAMRLIRDFPEADLGEEDAPPERPETLWHDLPGLPRGLP